MKNLFELRKDEAQLKKEIEKIKLASHCEEKLSMLDAELYTVTQEIQRHLYGCTEQQLMNRIPVQLPPRITGTAILSEIQEYLTLESMLHPEKDTEEIKALIRKINRAKFYFNL